MPYEAVECFWVEPNGKAVRTLRRFKSGDEDGCDRNEMGYHGATVDIGEQYDVVWSEPDSEDGAVFLALLHAENYRSDPRWPTHCVCGYEFTPEDEWQVNQEPVYESADGRKAWTSPAYGREPTPGAMFDTKWRPSDRKEDGLSISVVCPDGAVWLIDGQASGGGYWTRQGTPPKLTVTPSILTPGYHGYLTDGILTAG